jgi:hypothetical protein
MSGRTDQGLPLQQPPKPSLQTDLLPSPQSAERIHSRKLCVIQLHRPLRFAPHPHVLPSTFAARTLRCGILARGTAGAIEGTAGCLSRQTSRNVFFVVWRISGPKPGPHLVEVFRAESVGDEDAGSGKKYKKCCWLKSLAR